MVHRQLFFCLLYFFVFITTVSASLETNQNFERRQSSLKSCQLPKRSTPRSKVNSQRICSQEETKSAPSNVKRLFEDFWQWKLKEYPESATWYGIHIHDDLLTNVSIEAYNNRYESVLTFLLRLDYLNPCVTGAGDVQNLKVLKYDLESFKEGHNYNGYFFPLDNLWGIEQYLPKVFERMPHKTLEDYEKLLTRMEKIPARIDDIIKIMRAGMKFGVIHHYNSIKGLNESIGKLIEKEPSMSSFYNFFKDEKFPQDFDQETISQLQKTALKIVKEKIFPAFGNLKTFLEDEYKTREYISSSSLPDGLKNYQRLIRIHTSSDFSPKQIHEIGLCEVARISAEMEKITTEIGYSGRPLKEVTRLLKSDPNNYHRTVDELILGFEKIIKLVEPKLPNLFKKVPTYKVKVTKDPSPLATLAYYENPPLDGSKPGSFVVGTSNPRSNPKFEMITLTLHEANPGHHLQISYALEFSDLPMFRRSDIGQSYTSSGFPSTTAYTEGWALYAEFLGFEMNLFDDPLDRFGYYTSELFRACRLVVDTGIHALGWTRDEAIKYMSQNLPYDEKDMEKEVDRYITWPGQALGYKMGELRISDMRRKAEIKLKDDFDKKEFHDLVLSVSNAPLDVIEETIDHYIESNIRSRGSLVSKPSPFHFFVCFCVIYFMDNIFR